MRRFSFSRSTDPSAAATAKAKANDLRKIKSYEPPSKANGAVKFSRQEEMAMRMAIAMGKIKEPTAADRDETSNTRIHAHTVALAAETYGNLNQHPEEHVATAFRVGVSIEPNPRYRPTMEDTHSFVYDFGSIKGQGYFAVFDGHAGASAAEWSGEHVHEYLLAGILDDPETPVSEILTHAFEDADIQLSQMARRDGTNAGCTAVVCFLRLEDDTGHAVGHGGGVGSGVAAIASPSRGPSRRGSIAPGGEKSPAGRSRRGSVVVIPGAGLHSRRASIAPAESPSPVAHKTVTVISGGPSRRGSWEKPTPGPAVASSKSGDASPKTATANSPDKGMSGRSSGSATPVSLTPTHAQEKEPSKMKKLMGFLHQGNANVAAKAAASAAASSHSPSQPSSEAKSPSPQPSVQQGVDPRAVAAALMKKVNTRDSASCAIDDTVDEEDHLVVEITGPADVVKAQRRTLYAANAGDARAVLSRGGKAVRLTFDHKSSDPGEMERIAKAGGTVANGRVNGVLAVTRALGDADLKEFVIGRPFTSETRLEPEDDKLIVACDGLWDVCDDQKAVDLIKKCPDAQSASKTLLDYALHNLTTDNVTIMVVYLRDV